MFALIGTCVALLGVSNLQVVGLREVVAPSCKGVIGFPLECHTCNGVEMVLAHLAVVGEIVLHKEVSIVVVILAQAFIALCQIVGIREDEGREEGESLHD